MSDYAGYTEWSHPVLFVNGVNGYRFDLIPGVICKPKVSYIAACSQCFFQGNNCGLQEGINLSRTSDTIPLAA